MPLSNFANRLKLKVDRLFNKSNWNILTELIRANFKVQDYNSILGIFWSLLGPVMTAVVLYFIFRMRFGQSIREYPLYLLVGIACVNFFVTATTYTINIFFVNRDFVLNSTVQRETILTSALATHTYKFLIDLALCLILSVFYDVFSWNILVLILPLSIAFIALTLGVSLILSLLYCFAEDIRHIWMLITRLFYFVTPIFYTLNHLHPLTRKVVYLGNPLTPFVISFRGVFMGNLEFAAYMHSLLIGFIIFAIGYWAFIAIENTAMEQA